MKKPTLILFFDLSVAFFHVERTWLFKSMKKRFTSVSGKALIELVESLYSYTSNALTEDPDDSFQMNVGV